MSDETSYPTANAKRFNLDVDLDADVPPYRDFAHTDRLDNFTVMEVAGNSLTPLRNRSKIFSELAGAPSGDSSKCCSSSARPGSGVRSRHPVPSSRPGLACSASARRSGSRANSRSWSGRYWRTVPTPRRGAA